MTKEKDEAFCMDELSEKFCCGEPADCCAANIPVIVSIVIAGIVALAASIFGCCFCCTCCVYYDKLHKRNNEDSPPVAEAQPMEKSISPSVTVEAQA